MMAAPRLVVVADDGGRLVDVVAGVCPGTSSERGSRRQHGVVNLHELPTPKTYKQNKPMAC